jgi:cardiolipin synthase
VIANAYFLPGHKLRRALIDAAARGVRVRLLLQGKIEYRM